MNSEKRITATARVSEILSERKIRKMENGIPYILTDLKPTKEKTF